MSRDHAESMGLENITMLYNIPDVLLLNTVATDPTDMAAARDARDSPDLVAVLQAYLETAAFVLGDITRSLSSSNRPTASTPPDPSPREKKANYLVSDKEATEVILGCSIMLSTGDWERMAPWADDPMCRHAAVDAILTLSPTAPAGTPSEDRGVLDSHGTSPAVNAVVCGQFPSLLRTLWARLGAENAELGIQGAGTRGKSLPADCGLVTPHAYITALQLLWCIRQVPRPHLEDHCGALFPTILRGLDHTKQCVKRVAMRALLATVERVSPTSARVHGEVLLDAVRTALIGCEAGVWPQALETAVAVARVVEGDDPRGKWYGLIFQESLLHMERRAWEASWRLPWLRYIGPLMDALGLFAVQHFKRLMPLMSLWVRAQDDETCLAALELLRRVIIVKCWPRMASHAARLAGDLAHVYKHHAKSDDPVRAAGDAIARLLLRCGGLPFAAAWQDLQQVANNSVNVSTRTSEDGGQPCA